MEYTIGTPEILGNVASLHRVAAAMARTKAMAGGKGFKKPTYDGALRNFTATLIKAARAGQLQVCNQFDSPGNPDELVAIARKEGRLVEIPCDSDLTIAFNVYVNLQQLNAWAATLGRTFSITHDGAPWMDETGWNNVVGVPPDLDYRQELAEPEEVEINEVLEVETKVISGAAPVKRSRKPSWSTTAMPYMKSLFVSGKYRSASMFYEALMLRAGQSDSPFKLVNRELYCTDAGTTVSKSTLGNVWPQIRAQ